MGMGACARPGLNSRVLWMTFCQSVRVMNTLFGLETNLANLAAPTLCERRPDH